jgi:hypothetical protein
MSQPSAARRKRGTSTMRHPRPVINQEFASYESRFGPGFASRMRRGSWLVVISAWVMVVGLIGMLVVGVGFFFATGSLSATFVAMYAGFAIIIAGAVVGMVGRALRGAPIQELSRQIIAFDPKVTLGGAGRLIRDPQLYSRWMTQHPGFRAY